MHFNESTKIEDLRKEQRPRFIRWKKDQAKTPEEKFWPKVNVGGPDDCWEFKGHKDNYGYGIIVTSYNGIRKRYKAHRISWILSKGHIPDGLLVCHKCDNPPCCNPNHLFLGTQKENMQDCGNKKRHFSADGEKSVRHKLSECDVLDILRRYHPKVTTFKLLSKEFGVAISTIQGIVEKRRWKYLHNHAPT